jgi:hypothetical protein
MVSRYLPGLSLLLLGCAPLGFKYEPHPEPVTAEAGARWEGSDRVDVILCDSSSLRLRYGRVKRDTLWGKQAAAVDSAGATSLRAIPLAGIRSWTWWRLRPPGELRVQFMVYGSVLLVGALAAALGL